MKSTLAAGLKLSKRITVDRDRTISFMGEELRVYATPKMVMDVEMTSRELLLSHMDAGEDSVGTRVEIDHVAAALNGSWVEITSTIKDVDRRRIVFEFSVRDAIEEIGKGVHTRFVVETAKTRERLLAKLAKLNAAG